MVDVRTYRAEPSNVSMLVLFALIEFTTSTLFSSGKVDKAT